jgi:hypothetical protein
MSLLPKKEIMAGSAVGIIPISFQGKIFCYLTNIVM